MIADVPASSSSPAASKNAEALLATMRTASRQSVRSYEERVDALDALARRLRARQDAIVQNHRERFRSPLAARDPRRRGLSNRLGSRARQGPASRLDGARRTRDPLVQPPFHLPGHLPAARRRRDRVAMELSGPARPGTARRGPRRRQSSLAQAERARARTAELLSELVAEAFAPDLVGVVTGGPEVASAFTRLPFDHLVFTGSTRVGQARDGRRGGEPGARDAGARREIAGYRRARPRGGAAGGSVMAGKLFSAGQTCIAPDYALVPRATRAAFVEGCRAGVFKMYPRWPTTRTTRRSRAMPSTLACATSSTTRARRAPRLSS